MTRTYSYLIAFFYLHSLLVISLHFVMRHWTNSTGVLNFTTIRTENSKVVLEGTLATLLAAFAKEAESEGDGIPILYQLYYEQPRAEQLQKSTSESKTEETGLTFRFPPLPVDLMVQDAPLDVVKEAWRRVMGEEAESEADDAAAYMQFVDREGNDADDME